MEKKQPELKQFNLRYLVFIVLIVSLSIIFSETLLKIMLIPFLFFLGCISTFYKRFTRVSLGIELITFATLFYTLSLGTFLSIIASIFMVFIAALISNRLCIPTGIQIICYILTILITSPLKTLPVIAYGIIFVFLFNLFLHFTYVFIMNFQATNSITSFIINLALNLYLINNILIKII